MILLTGATGFIGSHTWVELLTAGESVLGVDNFCNSSPTVIDQIRTITNQDVLFEQGDVRDSILLTELFKKYPIKSVIHFAALKAVGDSVKTPLTYYQNNINGLLSLLEVMRIYHCHQFVFSSSATVYHPNNPTPYIEGMTLGAANPYGWTKYICEQILRDYELADTNFSAAILRYFNPIGAHASGLIGEDPQGVPNNLMPYITQVAVGIREFLSIYGNDWPTHDGTGVRDYIHVTDIAKGHIKALEYLRKKKQSLTINLGSGKGYSVLELIRSFESASGKKIPYKFAERRPGDIAISYADPSLAHELIDWCAEYDLEKMCQDSWRWQLMNPDGYLEL